ncbi:beta-hexosaminidase subunit beta-like [Sycon ciliatum]|uniref:beta-hexosaminidase subunit beta-like n=1 Tax=Sycon ciliatum TaxID=27933 RepID=UPI0031F5F37E
MSFSGRLTAFLAALCCNAYIVIASTSSSSIWPLPAEVDSSGWPGVIHEGFDITTDSQSPRLHKAIARYRQWIRPSMLEDLTVQDRIANANGTGLDSLYLAVSNHNETLNAATSYAYRLSVEGGKGHVTADTIYGAMYALESLSQVVDDGKLMVEKLRVRDFPRYRHRGFMIDTGRRFFPKQLVLEMLDAMSYFKLNVLHFHLSDYCRFAVESLVFPELTAHSDGFYRQDEIREIVEYAADRGIRVVPEFDFPGHSRGLLPLANRSVTFCSESNVQLHNDLDGRTVATLKALLSEMATLFPDKLFHIGCDETRVTDTCPLVMTRKMEQELQQHLAGLGKTPVGWEEILFSSKAALPGTVINTWKMESASQATAADYQAVASSLPHFYVNYVSTTYDKLWTDIGASVPAKQHSLLLGGEFSMWSDNYCYRLQCFMNGTKPVAWWMYGRGEDKVFRSSVTAMIWPRGIVAAGAFWNFQAGLDAQSQDFLQLYHRQTERLMARGIDSCPVGCKCDELTQCGVPYPRPPPSGP